MRPARLWAVAWRDLRLVHAGRGWWKLPALALGLLLPIGVAPVELPTHLEALPARAMGEIPPELAQDIESAPAAPVRFVGQDPVVVKATRLPEATRAALDTLPGETVTVHDLGQSPELPGRSLLVALLALSLLTGPLAESLAGERSRGTLTSLRSAGISSAELVGGKWLAWTLAATGTTLLVALSGVLSGAQTLGVWPLGLPLVAATAVALGLWLGRGAADEVGAATRTMRVLPIAALVLGGLAYGLRSVHPALGAGVPLGGALLLSGDLGTGPLELLAALTGNALASAWMLRSVARSLDGEPDWLDLPGLARASGLAGAALLCWWLPVLGPGIWGVAGNHALSANLDPALGVAVGAAMLLGILTVDLARDTQPREWSRPCGGEVVYGAAAGALLSFLPALPLLDGPLAEMALDRSLWARIPDHPVALLSLPVLALFFWDLLRRASDVLAVLAWTLVLFPVDPLTGVVSGGVLLVLSRRWSWWAALGALTGWLALSSLW